MRIETPLKAIGGDVTFLVKNPDYGRPSERLIKKQVGPLTFTVHQQRNVASPPEPPNGAVQPKGKIVRSWYPDGGWPGHGPLIDNSTERSTHFAAIKRDFDPQALSVLGHAGLEALSWAPLGLGMAAIMKAKNVWPVALRSSASSGAGTHNVHSRAYAHLDRALANVSGAPRASAWSREYTLVANPGLKRQVGQRLKHQLDASATMQQTVGTQVAALAKQSQDTTRYLEHVNQAARQADALANHLPETGDRLRIGRALVSALEHDSRLSLGAHPKTVLGRLTNGGSGHAQRRYPQFVQTLSELMAAATGADSLYGGGQVLGRAQDQAIASSHRQRLLGILSQFADPKVSNAQLSAQFKDLGKQLRVEKGPVQSALRTNSQDLAFVQQRERGLQQRQEELRVAIKLLD